ncbi:MAG: nucleotidyltransferase family protein [Acidimicrobiia bacterium]
MDRQDELFEILEASHWFMRLLEAPSKVNAPNWWVGAGAVRDLVWDVRFGHGFDPSRIKDVDLAFFDPDDLSEELEEHIEKELESLMPEARWDAKKAPAWRRLHQRRPFCPLCRLRNHQEPDQLA